MKTILEITEILQKSGYLNFDITNKSIKFLPLGETLLNNIKREWYYNKGVINTYPISNSNLIQNYSEHRKIASNFIQNKEFRENFLHIKNNFQKEIPFAIKENLIFSNNDDENFDNLINLKNGNLLSCSYFINENSAIEYFHKIQRERKIWWMKFSANPGRYFFTDLKSSQIQNQKFQSIRIKSKFDFGILEMENVQVLPLKVIDLENKFEFNLKDVRLNKRVIPAVVRSELCLENAAFGFLLDALEDSKNDRIHLHRKIAPYQCSLFCFSEDPKILLELQDLGMHLTNLLRKFGISTLNLQKCFTDDKKLLNKEFLQMDRIGVPYLLVLESDTIQTGLLKLRNRDTTISEIIHVTDVPKYLLKIFNS